MVYKAIIAGMGRDGGGKGKKIPNKLSTLGGLSGLRWWWGG